MLWIRGAIYATIYFTNKDDPIERVEKEDRSLDRLEKEDRSLDRLIRGKKQATWNEYNVRYDENSHRWYLKLPTLYVREIRAKVWQYQVDNDE